MARHPGRVVRVGHPSALPMSQYCHRADGRIVCDVPHNGLGISSIEGILINVSHIEIYFGRNQFINGLLSYCDSHGIAYEYMN